MSYTYDYFVAALACPKCGRVSGRDRSTNLQTKLAPEPELRELGEGDQIEVPETNEEIVESGYRQVKAPARGAGIVLLEVWTCPACKQPFNWARVELAAGAGVRGIARIVATALDRETLEGASFISEEALHVAEQLEGRSLGPAREVDVIGVLRRKLPARRRP